MGKFTHFIYKGISTMVAISIVTFSFAQQIEISNPNDPPYSTENLISNIFLGEGVEITNVQFFGSDESIGYFQKGVNDIGIDRGIVMTTGFAKTENATIGVDSPSSSTSNNNNASTASDIDISETATAAIHNLVKYEISFIPVDDQISFNYVFASEEYPEYTCLSFNDIFGFYISGPNPSGGLYDSENIARVPGTNLEVSINNVHNGNPGNAACLPNNEQYYNDNTGSTTLVYDAYLDVFTAVAEVTPCEEYTIKLVIADQGDAQYDSAVFLEAKSFSTETLQVKAVTVSADGTIVEGCSEGELVFQLPEITPTDMNLTYNIIGDAVNGVDYQTISNTLMIPAGSNSASINLVAFEDNQSEPIESIGIDIQRDACNRDTFWVYIKDSELIAPDLGMDDTTCGGETFSLDGTSAVVIPSAPVFSSTSETVIFPDFTALYNDIEVSGVLPFTLGPETIASICIDSLSHPWIEDLDIFVISPSGVFIELTSNNGEDGGNGTLTDYYINTCFTPSATQSITFDNPAGAPASEVPFNGDFKPEGYYSDLWDGEHPTNGTWQLMMYDDNNGGWGTLHNWSITFNSTYEVTYEWSPTTGLSCSDCPSTEATPTQTTTYTVTATDSYGCQVSDDITITVAQTLGTTTITCDNTTTGEITFEWDAVTGATGYEINVNGTGWISPNQSDLEHLVDNLGLGETVNIDVRAIDDCGNGTPTPFSCISKNCIVPATSIANINHIDCNGDDDGSVEIGTTGGNGPFIFDLLGDANNTGIYTGLDQGDYTVVISDTDGCTTTAEFTINEPEVLSSLDTVVNYVSCFEGDDGSVSVELTGGTYPYNFNWDVGLTDSILTNLMADTFYVTVTDANNCEVLDTVELLESTPIQLTTTGINTECDGASTGQASVSANGGTPGYNYTWSNGATGTLITNLGPGTYYVQVEDAVGCMNVDSVIIGAPALLDNIVNTTPALCSDSSDGSIEISTSGGTAGYSYFWTGPNNYSSNDEDPQNLLPGTYNVVITDALGCTDTETAEVGGAPPILLTMDTDSVSCFGGTDGTAMVSGTGGTGNITFAWPDGTTTPSIMDLTAGNYTIIATDGNNCEVEEQVIVYQPNEINVTVDAFSIDCNDENNGYIEITPSGGTGDTYSFLWDTGDTSEDIDGLNAGDYTVVVTDANDCTISELITISEGANIVSDYDIDGVQCFGESSGSVETNINGGLAPYEYAWSNGSTQEHLEEIVGGMYVLTITDAENCEKIDSILVPGPTGPIDAQVEISNSICKGLSDGTMIINAEGGTAPYYYSLNGGSYTPNNYFIGLEADEYIIFIQDIHDCIASVPTVVTLEDPEPIIVELGESVVVDLGDEVSLVPEVTNQTGNLSYQWSSVDTSGISCMNCPIPTIQPSFTNTYYVTVTDENGCEGEDYVTVLINKSDEILVPTGFSPNGDGRNDRLVVHGTSKSVETISAFRIYDRWGEMVYQANNFDINDMAIGWDGSYKTKELNPGIYVWYLEVELIDGSTKRMKGETTLIR